MAVKSQALKEQLLKRGHTPRGSRENIALLPVNEMPLMLTLDRLRPNPDNPRTSRNPKYEEIKASIRVRGLDSVFKVTKNPDDDEDVYIVSDGGNTRYSILRELWVETQDEQFRHIQCIFKPWPGRLQCVIGHLAENDVRGDLLFIEKALGIAKAKSLYEEELNKTLSQRELESLLRVDGFPVTQSNISRMAYTVDYLYPYIPTLLNTGMGRPQIIQLIALRTAAQKAWSGFVTHLSVSEKFEDIFGQVCHSLDNPEVYTYDGFKDELIGLLLKTLPNPDITYDRWLIELDPSEQKRRKLFGEPVQVLPSILNKDPVAPILSFPQEGVKNPVSPPEVNIVVASKQKSQEKQLDLYGQPKSSKLITTDIPIPAIPIISATQEPTPFIDTVRSTDGSSMVFANGGLEPVTDIWLISKLQDDIEHLQAMAFRLAYELAEAMGIENNLQEDKRRTSAGYALACFPSSVAGAELLIALSGEASQQSEKAYGALASFGAFIIGAATQMGEPLFDDVGAVKFLRLVRVLRRLRELQRAEVCVTAISKDANDA
ncbi:ParB family protein [Yersinia wautersii]|uniref:Putative ATP/GTP binding protein n=1 Tax=Yersinia pseudotuberculosis TaxID=633 RepID=A0A380Q4K2_YERPU|nr:ParB family protein [Yersinia pseudotuberculosis]SUP80432.1 putative ATP/GTP binding protein [Yersinia pseudotuberculosis]